MNVPAGGRDLTVVGKDEARAEEATAELARAGGDGSVSAAGAEDSITRDVVVLAVYYPDARAAVEENADQLAGRVVVDITNPVNESFDALVVGLLHMGIQGSLGTNYGSAVKLIS